MTRRRAAVLVAGLLVVATASLAAVRVVGGRAPTAQSSAVARAAATARASAAASPSASLPKLTVLDRLAIASMRARTYPASTLTVVRDEGDQGGYQNSVVSFVSDGLTEYSLMSIPDGTSPAAGWPVVIINHGFIDPPAYVTDDQAYVHLIAAFARAGYMVLKPDYRGHGQSQGVAEGGHLSPVYTYDLLNLVSTLKADRRVDPTRIGLFGHSMGGHVVLRAMVVSSDIKAVVFMAGVVGSMYDIFYNWPQRASASLPSSAPQQQVGSALVQAEGGPKQNPAFWDSVSAINYVASSSAAVQINQDVDDTQVPKLFSDHLAAALQAAGKPFEYNTYPGDDHGFIQNRAAIVANAVAFYQAHL